MKYLLHRKWLLMIMSLLAVSFVALQFIRPNFNNPAVTSDIVAPVAVKKILINACYDCHSNLTRLSWFDKITPANWMVARDIRDARKVLNFSEWDKLTIDRQKGILFESLNHMQYKLMPLPEYVLLHPGAKIGANEINILQSYLTTLIKVPLPDTAKTRAWNDQYNRWTKRINAYQDVAPSPNGIDFMSGYKDWVVISSTERTDDGRLRIITGNDIVVNAIKTNQVNPWPDGSTFAKIAWTQVVDSFGNISAGEFKQVAFMIKDKVKYRSTDGWGFAQWVNGTELSPYGSNPYFATGCKNCHRPMKKNDFVFTMPLNLAKDHALEDKLIGSFVNKKEGTSSNLYGNNIATVYARTSSSHEYPRGSNLTLVTWIQKKDANWFGANIPGEIQSIEKIRFTDTGSPAYEKFGGNLQQAIDINPNDVKQRLHFILSQRASVMP